MKFGKCFHRIVYWVYIITVPVMVWAAVPPVMATMPPDPNNYQGHLYGQGPGFQPYGINEDGWVCGFYVEEYWANCIPPLSGWSSKVDMPLVTGAVSAMPHGINNNDQVVGTLTMSDNSTRGFVWSQREDTIMVIGTQENPASCYNLNDDGTVAGLRYNFFEAFPCKWEGPNIDEAVDLGSLGGSGLGEARGINNQGDIVGRSQTAAGTNEAFLYIAGTTASISALDLSSLGVLGESVAVDINDAGHIIGNATAFDGDGIAFACVPGSAAIPIEGLGGDMTELFAINNNDWIVGRSKTASGDWHAGITAEDDWEAPNAMIDLNTFLGAEDAAHWVLECATGINDNGWIIGYGTYDGQPHGFLMTPEPGALVLLAIGAACLIGCRRYWRGRR